MNEIPLPALEGINPLGFLAALGVLDALSTANVDARLHWTPDLVPHAVISGIPSIDAILDILDKDRAEWMTSAVLGYEVKGVQLSDAKPVSSDLRAWFEYVETVGSRSDADHLCALVAEEAFDNNGRAKPTHLHYTAGRQLFLDMVRDLARGVDRDRLKEATAGPWRYDSTLPSLSWDSRGERIYAVRAVNPSNEKRLGVPGADWLAFRGLVFYPVTRTLYGSLRTTACDADWKSSAFRWPLWTAKATRSVTRSLVADSTLVAKDAKLTPRFLAARGISSLRESKIRRNDQGGYGSFSGATTLAET